MTWQLGTQELADECLRRQDADPEFQEKFKGLTIKILLVGTDAPGNEDRQLALDIENGHFDEILVSRETAPSDLRSAPFDHTKYDCRAVAPQQTLIDLIDGKIDLITATQLVKLEGDVGKLITQMAGFMAFLEYLSHMGIEA